MRIIFRLVLSQVILILLCLPVKAQRNCGTAEYLQQLTINPSTPNTPSGVQRDTAANEVITIPVVIHLLYKNAEQDISDAQILSQIEALNNDYRMLNADKINTPFVFRSHAADCQIMFCLAQVDPDGHHTKGIIRKHTNNDYFIADDGMKYSGAGGDNAWDSKKYLNIWVCNMTGRMLGYSSIPGSAPDKDGVVINWDVFGTTGKLRASFNKGRTATHEIAHWLGLKHIWGDALCGDDGIDDTPMQENYNFGCPSFPKTGLCSPNVNGEMFMNFMDFTDDGCMNMFTMGQKKKMRSLFALNGARNSFLNSFACDSTLASGEAIGNTPVPVINNIRVYPNPAHDMIHVDCTRDAIIGTTIKLYTMQGVELLNQTLHKNPNTINLRYLPAGAYLLGTGEKDQRKTVKIIKY